MKSINLKSNELNKLVRILDNYEEYVTNDVEKTNEYKNLILNDIHIIRSRISGIKINNSDVIVTKNLDVSVFGIDF
jgi:hypothetical protein|nr:MAG TPA: hypothetical protein [Caudoviricetes sp.]